jgi:hypothetical protein
MSKSSRRFDSKVSRTDSCWWWRGAKKPSGYGNFYMDGKYLSAHRASWMLHRGPIPDGMNVLHRCDIPSCVNPDHLFLGSHKENFKDMMRKGRARGAPLGSEFTPMAKLTRVSVSEIRALRKSGAKLREIAGKYGVSLATISLVCSGKTWAGEHDVWLADMEMS